MTPLARYTFAALLILLETAVFLALGRLLDLHRAPFLLFTPSVLLAAMFGGRDAGLFATLLGILAAEVVFLEEARSRWETFELVRMALFAVSGAAISVMAGHLQQARARAESRAEAAGERADEHARLFREAQSASRLKDEFVATLSHELRTPLNALIGWTELLRSGQLAPERMREAIDAIHRTALAQAQLTNDLVDVSRAVSGTFRLRPEDVDIGRIVRDTTETFRLAAESKGLRLTCEVAPQLPCIVADPDRLRQIVYNLVGNAVKFTASGVVHVEARADGDWITLGVRDTGIGIAASFQPYVFDRFRQADGSVSREFGGLGLGLSIVRALVELHGGTVMAASAGEGLGATFTVRLPVAPPHTRQTPTAVGAQSA